MSLTKFLDPKGKKEKNKNNVLSYLESQNEVGFKEIKFGSIIFSAFSHLKCQNCGMYRRNYHCLATPTWEKNKEMLSKYDKIYIVYIQKNNKPRIKDYVEKREKAKSEGKRVFTEWLLKRNAINANNVQIVSKIKRFFEEFKKSFPDKKIVRIFGAGGGCLSCRICGLIYPQMKNEPIIPCKKPNKTFPAPESRGIDVYWTLRNNNIEFQVIPEDLVLSVGIVFVKEDK